MKKIILIGMKACGKTTIGNLLSQKLDWDFIELDKMTESIHKKIKCEELSCSNIFKTYGKKYFRTIETEACKKIAKFNSIKSAVISCGGGTVLSNRNRQILKKLGALIFLDTDKKVLMKRILGGKIPSFIQNKKNPAIEIMELINQRKPLYNKLADQTIKIIYETPEEIANNIIKSINL